MNIEQSFFLGFRAVFLGSLMWLGLLAGSEQVHFYADHNQDVELDTGLIAVDQEIAVLSQFDWNSFTASFSNTGTASSFQQVDFKYRMKYVCRQSVLILKNTAHIFFCLKERIEINKRPRNPIHLWINLPPAC